MNFQQFFFNEKTQLFYIVQLNRVELDDRKSLINHGSTRNYVENDTKNAWHYEIIHFFVCRVVRVTFTKKKCHLSDTKES